MVGMLLGLGRKRSQAADQTVASGLQLQSSSLGKPFPIVYGATRIAPNLIWYGDFQAIAQQNSVSGGKGGVGGGGGGKGGGGSTSYTYQTAVAMMLCEGPISGVGNVYVDKNITTLAALGLTLFTGTYPQSPWGYLSTNHPDQALGYNGIAYVASSAYALGNSPQLPNHNFEVMGVLSNSVPSSVDADASQLVTDLLTNSHYGIGFPSGRLGTLTQAAQTGNVPNSGPYTITVSHAAAFQGSLDVIDAGGTLFTCVASSPAAGQYTVSNGVYTFNAANAGTSVTINYAWLDGLTQYQNYTLAAGLLVSVAYDSQTQLSSLLSDLAKNTNSEFVCSSGVLTLVPYGDDTITGNGKTYIPPASPLYDLTDDDFLPNTNGSVGNSSNNDPVILIRKRAADALNSIQLEYLDRTASYNPAIVEAKDQAAIDTFGLRSENTRTAHMFADANAAKMSVTLQLQREQVRNQYQFTLDQRYILLDPMDIVTLTDSTLGLNNQWVRIKQIALNQDDSLTFLAEEYLAGTGAAPLYSYQTGAGYSANYNSDPGAPNTPVIFEPTAELAESLDVYLFASGGPLWGGCEVYISNDGTTYKNVGRISGSCRTGVLTASLASVALAPTGLTLDNTNTLSVDLSQSHGQLQSASQSDALSLASLSYVDGEYIAYQTATLTGNNAYNLTKLVRGAYGSTIASHMSGGQFARMDGSQFVYPFTQDAIGKTIYIKLVSFNIFGGGLQSLADVEPFAYTLTGAALSSPLPDVTNLRSSYIANITQLTWDEVTDFRTVLYEVRQGDLWDGGQYLGRVAHPPFTVIGNGTYWVAAYSQPTPGLRVYSESPQQIVVTGAQISENIIATYDESATGWTGTVGGSAVVLDGNVVVAGGGDILSDPDYLNTPNIFTYGSGGTGTYTVPGSHIINVGRIAPCAVIVSWTAFGTRFSDNILTVGDYLGDADILDYEATNNIDIYPNIALSQDGTTWGPWQKYAPGTYLAMAFKAQAAISVFDPDVEAVLSAFTFSVDVPDRDDHYVNLSVPSGGTTLSFAPDGSATPTPFNGGPPGSPTIPNVQVTILNSVAGDQLLLTSVSLSGCTIQILNGGVGVARNVNVLAQGF